MNACIEMLNHWGDNFFSFAWPMFWQSSLLIAIVFAFDFFLAKKIRASIRYALWMVVLVKLLLPPALALPTGATWWLWRPKPVIETPDVKNYTVTTDDTVPPENFVPQPIQVVVPPPKLSGEAWTLLVSAAAGMGLLLWLAFRWTRVARKVRRAATSDAFADILEETRRLAGLRGRIRLKLIDDTLSPAVYGLFRPVILLPFALMDNLSTQQLRAVLLHEAIHLRRGDVWVNCAQTLLQLAYWWHPLLWLANARIRRVREEAVDDAVMAALRDGADTYAPTLLEVAKFAFRRPLASLGLVGIMESRSALRQRIERLVDFRPPRKAGITFLSLCGIFMFSAVALPMGEGPAQTTDSFSPVVGSEEKTLTMTVNPEVFIRNLKAKADWVVIQNTNDYGEILLRLMDNDGVSCNPPHGFAFNTKTGEITTQNMPDQLEIIRHVIEQLNRADGKFELPSQSLSFHRKKVMINASFFWMTGNDLNLLTADVPRRRKQGDYAAHWTADAAQFKQIEGRIKALGLKPFQRPRVETAHGVSAEMYCGISGTNWIRFSCLPYVDDHGIALTFKAESDSVSMQDSVATTNRSEVYSMDGVENNGGIVVSAKDPNNPETNLVVVLNVKNLEDVSATRKKVPWPDPNFEGDRFVNLRARFLILDESQLRAAIPSLANARQPVLLSSDETGDYLSRLTQGGARCFVKGWENGILQAPLSGGYQYYRIGSSTDGNSAITALTTNRGGSFSNMLYGWDILTPSTQPDWTPMNLTLRALMQDGSTLCQMDLSFPNTGAQSRHSEMTLPNGDALVWVANPPNAPGKYQVIILSPFSNKQEVHRSAPENLSLSLSTTTNEDQQPVTPVPTGSGRKAIYKQLKRIRFDTVSYQALPLSEVIRQLHEQSVRRDPDKVGINFLFNPNPPQSTINPATGLPEKPDASQPLDPNEINITLKLSNVAFSDLLNAICKAADHPITYSVEDYGIVFSGTPNYEMRTFKVGTNVFFANLQKVVGPQTDLSARHVGALLQKLFSEAGVDLSPPKSVFYNNTLGVLFVYATPQDLDVIERIVQKLNDPHIKQDFQSMQDGEMLYEMGKLDEAKSKLNDALKLDPGNKEARYYLKLVQKAKDAKATDAPHFELQGFKIGPVSPVAPTNLVQGTFPVDYQKFITSMRRQFPSEEPLEGFKQLAAQAGVDLSPPKTLWLDGLNVLLITATKEDLKILQQVVGNLHCFPPQIHIKVRFIEVPNTFFARAPAGSLTSSLTNEDILTAAEAKKLLHQILSQKGIEELAEPEGVTASTRQIEMLAGEDDPVITNPGSSNPKIGYVQFGQVFYAVPTVLTDNYTINLWAKAAPVEWFRYPGSTDAPDRFWTNSAGTKFVISKSFPVSQMAQAPAQILLNDGQTLVLFPKPEQLLFCDPDEKPQVIKSLKQIVKEYPHKTLIVLISATLIDAAGNRIHSDDGKPLAQNTDYFDPVIGPGNP